MYLNLTPKLSLEPRFCKFIINGYYTKSKRLQSLNFFLLLIWAAYNCSQQFFIVFSKKIVYKTLSQEVTFHFM